MADNINTITSNLLAPIENPLKPVDPPQDTTNYAGITAGIAAGFDGLNKDTTAAETAKAKTESDIMNSMNFLLDKTSDTQKAEKETGATSASEQISNLNAQAQMLLRESQAIPLKVQEQNRNTGATDAGVAPQEAGALRINALKALSLAQQYDIAKGNYDIAKEKAKQIIDLKYKPEEDRLNLLKQQYEFNKDALTAIDKKRTEALTAVLAKEEAQLTEKKANAESISKVALKLAENNAPKYVQDAVNRLDPSDQKSYLEAIKIASGYLTSPQDKIDMDYKTAQIAKIYNDMKAEGTIEPSNLLAYAQEYAATGKIPTGIPKNTFGQISAYAKELPKQDGEIVSTATGVRPTTDTTYQDAIANLSSAIKLAKQLKELDKERIGGVVSGTFGKIFGDEDQQKYVDLRTQIVDLLSRARSGAALTAQEEKRYSDMLPGRFSEPFGFGANSDVRIDNFVNALTSDALNKASAKGWSLYNMSKVKVGDNEYTVGDLIMNQAGQQGRVNADGTITLI